MPLGGDFTFINSATTTAVTGASKGVGVLDRIIVGTTAAGTIKVYDAASGTTDQILELAVSVAEGTYEVGARFSNGITVVTAAASLITIVRSEQ